MTSNSIDSDWATRPANVSADDGIHRLQQGNVRYRENRMVHPNHDPRRRAALVQGQHPFATILTCADSRVSPEIIFDQGLGDLMVARVAGNICDDAVLGTIEYSSMHLGVNLVVVMGHRGCGAVDAAVGNLDVDGPNTHSHIDALISAIRPAVDRAAAESHENLLERSVRQHATMVATQIRESGPIVARLTKHGTKVCPAYYDLGTGEVIWL